MANIPGTPLTGYGVWRHHTLVYNIHHRMLVLGSLVISAVSPRLRRCLSHPSGPIFHPWYIHSWNNIGAENIGVENTSPTRRAFRSRIVRCWHPLGRRAIELGKPPQAGGMCDVPVVYRSTDLSKFQVLTRPSPPGPFGRFRTARLFRKELEFDWRYCFCTVHCQ